MTVALGCASLNTTPEVVVRLLDHPRFQQVRPTFTAMEPEPAGTVATKAYRRFGKSKHVSPLVLIGTGALYLAIFADLYLRFLS